jgi:hypothetical protein
MSGSSVYPPIPVFPAGYAPLPADMDNWVQTPFSFLTSKPVFRAQYQGTLTLTATSFTQVIYDTILDDPFSGWDATSGEWTPPDVGTGWYEITMTAFTTNPSVNDQVQACLYLDGALYNRGIGWGVNGHATGITSSIPVAMVGGQDNVSAYIYSTASTTTTATAGQYPTMEIIWISQ